MGVAHGFFCLVKGEPLAMPAVRRERLAQEEARYKAAYAALMEGVERVLSRWSPKGLVPVVIKGSIWRRSIIRHRMCVP